MPSFDHRLSAYAGSVSRQIMASQTAASNQATAAEHAVDQVEWARPSWLWSVLTLIGRLSTALRRSGEPPLSAPTVPPSGLAPRVADER
jgi:hypothetical protein